MYRVREIFYSLQGEGLMSGTPAVFVRFTGCNLWSGHDQHRARDAKRHGTRCPLWCDTEFASGDAMSAEAILARIGEVSEWRTLPLIVFTGGEPLLQLDPSLLMACRRRMPTTAMAVETNGTVELWSEVAEHLDHVCVSPKTWSQSVLVRRGTELKIVVPAYDPEAYRDLWDGFEHLFVSPETSSAGLSEVAMQEAANYCLSNTRWRLSLQTHKVIGLP